MNRYTESNLVLTSFNKVGNLKAKQGDLIEIDRTIYSHWALYVGKGEIIHVDGEHLDERSTRAQIVKCRLVDLAGSSLVRVNNKYVPAKCRGLVALKPRNIIQNVLSLVGQKVYYNILNKNSEHFVTEWKYGLGWSDQSNMALQAMTIFSTSPEIREDSQSAHAELSKSIKSLLRCKSPDVSTP